MAAGLSLPSQLCHSSSTAHSLCFAPTTAGKAPSAQVQGTGTSLLLLWPQGQQPQVGTVGRKVTQLCPPVLSQPLPLPWLPLPHHRHISLPSTVLKKRGHHK